MTVRGAPAIAIAAMLSLAVELVNGGEGSQFADVAQAQAYILDRLEYLVSSRPTAVNLGEAAARLGEAVRAAGRASGTSPGALVEAAVAGAEEMLRADVAANRALGAAGAAVLAAACPSRARDGLRLLTHCNTGALATAGYGTALGVARALSESGRLAHVTCTETRPYNQGARLTAYELEVERWPATLVADSAAAALMARGEIDAVVVGADRVAANGDTANKIGTYSLAVAAAYHAIPFFIASPTTTLDPDTATGADITIEQRDPQELTHFRGVRVAADIPVWNPSFDVTPASIITGIITEAGVISPAAPKGTFDVPGFLARLRAGQAQPCADSPDPQPLGLEGVRAYVAARPDLAVHVGSPLSSATWDVSEVGDGNINFVYVVRGPAGSLCLKQSLPFVRMVGPAWPLAQARLAVEVDALRTQARICPTHVPAVYAFDPEAAVVAMAYIPPPHAILRGALLRRETFPGLASHVASFLGLTLFHTSFLSMDPEAFQEQTVKFANRAMCSLTEQVIFTDPYYDAPHNRPPTPHLADLVAELAAPRARLEATRLKQVFMYRPQALLHGDFHTGSLMVAPGSTYVIDAEFAFCGPIGFEVGKWVANLILAFFAVPGHSTDAKAATAQQAWLLDTARDSWFGFLAEFRGRWLAHGSSKNGGVVSANLFPTSAEMEPAVEAFLGEIADHAGRFAGAVIIRRLVGIARLADFETIPDQTVKARLERMALSFGIPLLYGEVSLDEALRSLQRTLAR